MPMTFRVVPITEAHVDGFYAVLDAVARERRYLLFLEAPPPEAVRKFALENIKKGYPHCVALDRERVIGWCDVLPIDRPTRAHNGVLGIGVLVSHRGKGVGDALMRATLERARSCGLTRVELGVRSGNREVMALYQRFGFVEEGVQRNAVRLDGRYEDVLLMGLLLA
jgi:RimJ/RimL family protein N-acetyltransferase